MELGSGEPIEYARMALRGAQAAQHGHRGVALPIDRPFALAHRRTRPRDRGRLAARAAGGERAHGLDDSFDRGAADLVTVQAALADPARGERARRPYIAAVEHRAGLEHGDAPFALAALDRPVQRRRPAVADRSGMDHQAAVAPPHRLGNDRLEHRADDDVRGVRAHGADDRRGVLDNRDLDPVPELAQRDLHALAETVVRRGEQQDPQPFSGGRRGGRQGGRGHGCHQAPAPGPPEAAGGR